MNSGKSNDRPDLYFEMLKPWLAAFGADRFCFPYSMEKEALRRTILDKVSGL